jgi:hypothetical protein
MSQHQRIFMPTDSSIPDSTGTTGGNAGATSQNDFDAFGRRVRLRPKPGGALQVYGSNGILQPLRRTNGLVWPYQPIITYDQQVDYQAMELVHANQEIFAYNRTNSLRLTVAGDFTVQNQQEGVYALAAIHFLRSVTKMYFGEKDPNAGVPPPVLLFDAYGPYMFNQLPVIVTQFQIQLNNDIDYVPVDLTNITALSTDASSTQSTPALTGYDDVTNSALITGRMFQKDLSSQDGYIWLPAVFNISVSITVQNTPYRLRQFELDKFRTGQLMKSEGRWI